MERRVFLAAGLATMAGAALAQTPPAPPDAYFADWLMAFRARALAAGVPQAVVNQQLSGLSPDPRVVILDARQPEFARPVSLYIEGAISPARVAAGRARRDEVPAFPLIEQTYGVPRDILIGIWAMESEFGAHQGHMDIIRCLATLAIGRRRAWAETQLIAALRMIAAGDVTRSELCGSWAGAMGQTQILPTVYLSTAVTASGMGRPDVWNSAADALATAANLMAKDGWARGQGWASEVILPAGFDCSLTEGPVQPLARWSSSGLRLAKPKAWRAADAAAPGMLLLPCGAEGPAFLAFPNHFVIRRYNNSIAYALAVGLLADQFGGGSGLVTPWPAETPLSLDQRLAAQAALAKLGYYTGVADGLIGVGTRASLRAWQKSQGLPADGYLSPALVARLGAAAART